MRRCGRSGRTGLLLCTAAAAILLALCDPARAVLDAGAGPAAAPSRPAVEALQFQGRPIARLNRPNGMTVLLMEERSQPLVSVMAGYRVGSVREAPGITGIAHFLEHMLFRATEELPGTEITRRIERAGGHWHGYTSFEVTTYSETVGSQHLGMVLHLEAQRLKSALIPEPEVGPERGAVIAELRGYENDPSSVLADAVQAIALTAHPLRYNVTGWVSDLEAITPADLREFYGRWYSPDRLVLGIVGDAGRDRVEELVSRLFDPIPRSGRDEPVRTIEPAQAGPRRIAVSGGAPGRRVQIAWPAPAFGKGSREEVAALAMMDALLAGGRPVVRYYPYFNDASPASRMGRAGDGDGLGFQSAWAITSWPFLYSLAADLPDGGDPAEAEGRIASTVAELARRPPDPGELAAAREEVRAATDREMASRAGACQAMVFFEVMGDLREHDALLETLDRVTPSDVAEAARALDPAKATIGWHLPPGALASARPGALGPAATRPGRASRAVVRQDSPPPPPRIAPAGGTLVPVRRRLDNGATISAAGLGFGARLSARVRIEAGPQPDATAASGTLAVVREAVIASLAAASREWPARLRGAGATVEGIGAGDPAFSDRGRLDFSIELPAASSGILPSLVAALASPAVGRKEIAAARAIVAERLSGLRGDAVALAPAIAVAGLMGLREPCPERLPEAREVESAIARWFTGRRIHVAVAGDADPAAVVEALAGRLASLPAGDPPATAPARRPAASAPAEGAERALLPGATQSTIAFALPAPRPDDPVRAAFELLATILHHGYGGRLGGDIVTGRGWAYSIDSRLPEEPWADLYVIRVATDPSHESQVRAAILSHLGAIRDRGPEVAEIQEAREMLVGRLAHRFETAESASAWLMEGKEPAEREARLRAVSSDQIEQARRWFDPRNVRVAIVSAAR